MKAEQKGVSSRYILVGLRKNLREKAEPQSDVGKVSRFPTPRNCGVSDGKTRGEICIEQNYEKPGDRYESNACHSYFCGTSFRKFSLVVLHFHLVESFLYLGVTCHKS